MKEKARVSKNKIRKLIEKTKIVEIYDYTNFCPQKCCDGGMYWYAKRFHKKNKNFEIEYETSAWLDYCPVYGLFQDCWNCPYFDKDERECCAPPETATTEEVVAEVINSVKKGFKVVVDGKTINRHYYENYCQYIGRDWCPYEPE